MEFHISRKIREKLDISDLLFSYAGNVVFANVAGSRKLAQQLNEALRVDSTAQTTVNAGALFAMGLIDELNHALIARYRKDIDPAVLTEALRWLQTQSGNENTQKLLLTFTDTFPNTDIFSGKVSPAQWLAGTSEDLPNREAAMEELLLLWLSNLNPAYKPFRELFDDTPLKTDTKYEAVTKSLPEYFETRPKLSPEDGTLLDALCAPMLASPDSVTGQLEFIREKWTEYLGEDLRRVLLAIDTLREEDIAIWMRFNPPGPDVYRHGAPGRGYEDFEGDEYIGFDGEWIVGPGGVRERRYSTDYQAPLNEYEAFSADQAWMPNVVMIAKSTYVWLEQLSKKYGRHIHRLDQVPDEELRLLASRGITSLWLIGLWERSIASKTIKHLRGNSDAVASAYSLKSYDIAEDLGGNGAYEHLREHAAKAGLRLASDMVPNHMGIDADWVIEDPEAFLFRHESPYPSYSFNGPDLSTDSRVEIKIEDHYYDQSDAAVVFRLRHHSNGATRFVYHGNDGTTFAWNDTAQLDYSQARVREQVMQAILHVARKFPIIRFDAAMVLAKRHVQRLWFPLPGAGGSIPSRAEDAMSQEQFDAMMPVEFWREVVDRVAAEVPGTLLLAEAFWMLEGYFVRTLGMHRVYNSAFMNMLRDEENAKYRSYMKKTMEFDPDILKRYVNFMSNPDERTAIDQFGSADKAFGVAILMSTMPGLPMFGHGQIEGYTERYGMEFKRAKMDEWPNETLVARHMHELAPLLKKRYIFAESANFVLYDFWHEFGGVDENVFAYSNRHGDERSIVLYNNRYEGTRGSIHISSAAMDKGSGELRQRTIVEGLALPLDGGMVMAYRDRASGLEYLRRASDLNEQGLTMGLRGYQYAVLLDWRELRSTTEQPWDSLSDTLNGNGVYSVDEAMTKLRLQPLHQALRGALDPKVLQPFADVATEDVAKPADAADTSKDEIDARLHPFVERAEVFLKLAPEFLTDEAPSASSGEATSAKAIERAEHAAAEEEDPLAEAAVSKGLSADIKAVSTLVRHGKKFSSGWPASVSRLIPSSEPGLPAVQVWAPIVAYLLIRNISENKNLAEIFETLHLRSALAEIFSSLGIEGENAWRSAARVGLLLSETSTDLLSRASEKSFWKNADVRWLASVNDSDGTAYLNKEAFDEVVSVLQIPALLALHTSRQFPEDLKAIENTLDGLQKAAEASGYRVEVLMKSLQKPKAQPVGLDEVRTLKPEKADAKEPEKADLPQKASIPERN